MTRWRYWVAAGLMMAIAAPAVPAAAADIAAARATVQSAMDEGISTFASGKTYPLEERTRRLEAIVRHHTDPGLLSAAVLGRSWAKLPPDQQAAFSERLITFVVSSYVGLLDEPAEGVTFTLGEGQDLGAKVRIPSEVGRSVPGVPRSQVDWVVAFTPEGQPGIVDLTVDGISLIRAMHEDFTSVMRNSGGRIEPLMEALARKIAANDAANQAAENAAR